MCVFFKPWRGIINSSIRGFWEAAVLETEPSLRIRVKTQPEIFLFLKTKNVELLGHIVSTQNRLKHLIRDIHILLFLVTLFHYLKRVRDTDTG